MKDEVITHDGVVKSVEGERVCVTIVQSSACSGCAARQMCNSADAKEKEIDVFSPNASTYRVGERVLLEGRLSDGRRAALIAYVLPLFVLLFTLFLLVGLTGNDIHSALGALCGVGLYYLIVFLFFRERLRQSFSFRIVSINSKNS